MDHLDLKGVHMIGVVSLATGYINRRIVGLHVVMAISNFISGRNCFIYSRMSHNSLNNVIFLLCNALLLYKMKWKLHRFGPWDNITWHCLVWYSLFQKKCNISEVAFLLEKSVFQWIWGYASFLMTPGYMTLTLGPRKYPQRKVAFLLEKTVCDEK